MISALRIAKQKGQRPFEDLEKLKVSKTDLEQLKNLSNAKDISLVFNAATDQGEQELEATKLMSMWQEPQSPVQILDVAVHKQDISQINLPDIAKNKAEAEQLQKQAVEILGSKVESYQQIDDDISNLEKQIREIEEFQRLGGVVQDLQAIKAELAARAQSVKGLSQQVYTIRAQFPPQSVNLDEEQLKRIRERLQQSRVPNTYQVNLKSSINDEETNQNDSQLPHGKAFLVLVLIDILLGLAAFLITFNVLVPVIAILVAGVILFLYSFYRQIPIKKEIAAEDLEVKTKTNVQTRANHSGMSDEEVSKLEKLMLQYSQSQILRGELNEIEEQLKGQLGDSSLEDLNKQIEDLNADIAELEAELAEKNKKFGATDTLEQRRTLELKRIDRMRLETELISQPRYQEYLQIKAQLDLIKIDMVQAEISEKIYQQITGYKSVRIENGVLLGLGANDQWVGVELTSDQQKYLSVFDTLQNWLNQEVITPILLVNWEKNLPRRLRSLFEQYVLQNKEKDAQVIYVDLVD